MRIVFGWNSFRLRSFSAEELGIFQKEASGISIEVRQAYFHIFWIPFFSLGKRWVVRKNNQLYKMPPELAPYVQSFGTPIRTPWYTFAGPILILVMSLGFWIQNINESRTYHDNEVAYFNADKAFLDERLAHLNTNDIITLKQISDNWEDQSLYLKIEEMNGDSILITPVESSSARPMDIEREYNRYVNSTPSVKISYKQLRSAYPKVFDSSARPALKALAENLLGDGKAYIVKDVIRHFGPIIGDAQSGSYDSDISIHLYNEGWPATVTDIKTLQGTVDWSQNIDKVFPGNQNRYASSFFLFGKNYKAGEPYKLVMTLKDTTGQVYKYEIDGQGSERTIRAI